MKKKQFSILLLFIVSSLTGFAIDRHVYPGGSIQTAVNSAVSGDRILIHAGTYSQVVSMSGRTNLTITNAGDGEAIVQGNSSDGATFWIENSSSITVSYLTIKNTRKLVWSTGITVIGSGSNIQIIGNKITDISYRSGAFDASDNPDNNGAQFQGVNAISIVGSVAGTSFSNIIIKDNEVSYCMTGWSEAIALKGNVDGFNVENNKVHHITNIGIDAFGLGTFPQITTNNQARNGTIKNNEVYNCICNYTDNGAIYIDGGLNISVVNNKVYNSKYGITIGCENQIVKPDGATEFIEVRNNLVYNNSRAAIMVGTGGDDDGQQGITRNCKITGNTFVKNATGDQWAGEVMLQNANNIEFYNNIFYGTWGRIGTVNNGSFSNTFGHNIFFSGTGTTIDFSKQTGPSTWISQTFAQFKADHNDNSSFSQDPQLINAAISSLNAHLQATSPAINAGKPAFVTLAGEKDLDGEARIFGSAVDIGIDEYGSSSSGSPTIIVNGNLSDWSSIGAITTANGQTSTSMKVYSNASTLYFGIAGSGMSSTDYQIFINSDNNAATGYQDNQFTSSGADYMIENGTLYRSTGTSWSWSNAPATLQVSKSSGVTELGINRSAFSSLSSTIKVAYKDMVNFNTISKLPSTGGYASHTFSSARRATIQDELVDDKIELSISVYPNPTRGNSLQVKYNVPNVSAVTFKLFDMQGREIYFRDLGIKQPGKFTYKIPSELFSKGLYILQLNIGNSVMSERILSN